ncbi:hypothetical protein ACFQE1_14975 [Halobium palmae]|uniref:DHFR domain-containing protein n=1 Tax=Halobium palmae TaxID=1776492 RepID=A0ABD5S204_9EURY
MLVTEVPESPDGDTFFPERDAERWVAVDRTPLDDGLVVVEYERRRG